MKSKYWLVNYHYIIHHSSLPKTKSDPYPSGEFLGHSYTFALQKGLTTQKKAQVTTQIGNEKLLDG